MAGDLPEPLTPADVDLRGYDFMPIYGEFLRRSDFNSRVTDAEFRAGFNLWWSSWWQVPAASLPDDDAILCKLADLRSIRTWRRLKSGALSGFVLCSDFRWHHSFLSVIARNAFAKRKSSTIKGVLGANKRWGNKGRKDAPATSTVNASSKRKEMPQALPQASPPDSSGYGKRSEVNNKHLPVAKSRPVDNSPSPAARAATANGIKLRTDPPSKPTTPEPTDDQLLEQLRKPVTLATAAVKAANGTPPPDWEATAEGVDHAGQALGMKRLPFEDDPEFAARIHARLALG